MDMQVEPRNINSSDKLDDIEHNFRVSAGPGAGKTHWLVNHIKEVLYNSKRLDKSRKVACITYTNTAVKVIRDRLGSSSNQVEVSTIHSFLYRHVIKPYLHFIADEYGFDVSRLDGHDEVKVSKKKIKEWIENHSSKHLLKSYYSVSSLTNRPENLNKIARWLNTLTCESTDENNLVFKADRSESYIYEGNARVYLNAKAIDILETNFSSFKKLYWNDGYLHHDDVLFFSFQIIKNHPFILDVLRAKFPYFFVDEFQDSNPIQVELLRQIGERDTIVGIIGDKAQSIFQFQGANPKQFGDFQLKGIQDYKIDNNRRSTKEIINLLNHIRPDFKQQGQDEFNGNRPILYVGDSLTVLQTIEKILFEEEIITLSWKNITANALKKDIKGIDLNENLFKELKGVDSPNRYRLVIPCITAVELCRENKIKEALNELKRYFGRSSQGKKDALDLLFLLNSRYDEYCNEPLMTLYSILRANSGIEGLSSFRAGNPKDFYDNTNYNSLALCVNIVEDTSNNITIHKSKGAEFDNILLVLDDEKKLNFITASNLDGSEEHRLKYVAISRAKKNLFISVPSLDKATAKLVEDLEIIKIIRI